MKKNRALIFKCGFCGHEEPKWLGRCPECGEWNSLVETAVSAAVLQRTEGDPKNRPRSLPLSSVDPQEGSRISSGLPELDRVLGGGIMKRSAVLLGGEPGIGKSTLLLQAAAAADTRGRVLYISGEESAGQLRMRADRLGLGPQSGRIEVCCTGALADITPILEAVKPVLVMADSAQTLHTDEAGPAPGTVNQMKFCSYELISWVKEHDAALFLAAHVTKDGLISGPKTLEHMVDTVLYFEQSENRGAQGDCRFLRAVKNRFGSVDEIGIFMMGEKGLSMASDPSLLFLVRREGTLPPGVATAAVLEGSRTLLVEIQVLTVPVKGSMSRVFSGSIDLPRVSRVAASLEKHLSLRLSDQDIYVNVAGGIRITEVGVELALAAALYSARTGLPLPGGTAIAGELSLTGELLPIRRLAGRIKTARGLGFNRFVGPSPASEGEGPGGLENAADIKSAVKILFAGEQKPQTPRTKAGSL
ncbi:MAG: DNA repair protein RadA [Treponema sp.]|jgi:DNA repair protein RadA/Sms|nr:DNA repair protein RadA [Treponema sp.]